MKTIDDRRLPLMLVFDCEPDRELDAKDDLWLGVDRLLDVLAERRDAWSEATGRPVNFTLLVRADRHIAEVFGEAGFALRRFEGRLRAMRESGDLLGAHVHPISEAQRREDWREDVVADAVQCSVDSFSSVLGTVPDALSLARGFTTDSTIDLMRRHGITLDLSVWPDLDLRHSWSGDLDVVGPQPDLAGVPRVPYRPDPTDWRSPARAETGPWVFPSTCVDGSQLDSILRRTLRRLRRPLRRRDPVHAYLAAVSKPGFPAFVAGLRHNNRPYLSLHMRSHRFASGRPEELIDDLVGKKAQFGAFELTTPAHHLDLVDRRSSCVHP